jgi:hypothetical protein
VSPHLTPFVATTGPEDLAHLVHYGIVAAGVAGVTALLLPAFLERARPATHLGDEHDRRVSELRERVAHGTLALPPGPRGGTAVAADRVADEPAAEALLVPVVVVSSLAAAGVHAAVAPQHLTQSLLVGSFFVTCAFAQLGWGALAWRRRTPDVLWAGILGNLGVLSLWLASRTVGVPGLGGPEPVGPWDLTCALWEVVVVVGCLRLRRRPATDGAMGRGPLHPFVLFWLVLSVLALGLLSVSGASA